MRRSIILLLPVIFILSCGQNKNKPKEAPAMEKKLVTDTVSPTQNITTDSSSSRMSNYFVMAGRSYLFSSADQQSKTGAYLAKGDLVLGQEKKGDFVYVIYTSPSGDQGTGWLLLNDLEEVLFTPPKVVKDEK